MRTIRTRAKFSIATALLFVSVATMNSPAFAAFDSFDCNEGAMVLGSCAALCQKYNRYVDVYEYGDCDQAQSLTCQKLGDIVRALRRSLVRNNCLLEVWEKQFFDAVLN